MDKFKSIAKDGWKPAGDPSISRKTWKSDLKGMATGKKNDPYAAARAHDSAPLSTLKDPDSFGPPPRHSARGEVPPTPTSASTSSPVRSQPRPPQHSGGLGGPVPAPRRRQEEEARLREEEEQARAPPEPYRTDTTGLRTDNLPKPPVRRNDGAVPGPPARASTPATNPAGVRPTQQRSAAPPPVLPPRMNEHPDEHTPAPPPPYAEATRPLQQNNTRPLQQNNVPLNQAAVGRLSQAGVSVPGFGIGNGASSAQSQSPAGHAGQLSELQTRFSRVNTASNRQAASSVMSSLPDGTAAAAVAATKKPPPPPPKKAVLTSDSSVPMTPTSGSAAPPLPLSSKPRPP